LFDSAIATDAPADDTPVVEDAPAVDDKPAEQPRDDAGRFASKDPAPVDPKPETPEAEDDKSGQVPSWRLREISEERRQATEALATEKAQRAQLADQLATVQRQLAEMRKPAPEKVEVPDPLLDPTGYQQHIDRTWNEKLLNQQREFDLRLTRATQPQAFDAAYAAAQQAIAKGDTELQMRMQRSSTPGDTLMAWHRERQIMQEVGTDPAAYRQKLLDEALKDSTFLAKALEAAKATATGAKPGTQPSGKPAINLPPSLTNVARSDHVTDPDDNDVSDEGLFRYATR
jgi:hypothetical protein